MEKTKEELERQIKELRRQLTFQRESLEYKNRALDAMRWVWCSGGCKGGVARYTDEPLTEDLVKLAETNTIRLRSWFENHKIRELHLKHDKQ
jgi:hypothetical protein